MDTQGSALDESLCQQMVEMQFRVVFSYLVSMDSTSTPTVLIDVDWDSGTGVKEGYRYPKMVEYDDLPTMSRFE